MVTKTSFALEQHLRSWTWTFERADGSLIHPSVEFLRSARLKGLMHDNEFIWMIDGDVLNFRSSAGRTTTCFDTIEGHDDNGVPILSGAFVGPGPRGVRHRLRANQRIEGPRTNRRVPVCLVVPIHPPYFIYGVNLVVQSLLADYRLCFVFTTHAERLQFAAMIQDGPAVDYLWIVMADHASEASLKAVGERRSFPTFKKFWAIDQLSAEFDYIVCVDAETFILRDHGWLERSAEIFERRFWCGGSLLPAMRAEAEILRASACDLAPDHARPIMHELVTQTRAYTWWWDLPVYKTDTIADFFAWMNWSDQDSVVRRLNYYVFDHICYQYYLVLNEGFDIRRFDAIVHSMEFSDAAVVKYAHQAAAPGAWVNAHAYVQDPRYFQDAGYLAVYHLDRQSFPQFTRIDPINA